MNRDWIEKPKSHYSKFPKQLHRSDFKLEYNDIITLLGRVMGLDESIFKEWRFYVISQIVNGVHYHWVGIISDNLHM